MENESIEVPISEEGGTGLPPEIPPSAPSEAPKTDPTAEKVEEVPVPTVPELYELPDGRKVDAKTLYKEHTENLLPEFTRRSQELAELKKGTTLTETKPTEEWVPQTFEELLAKAEERVFKSMEEKQQQQTQVRQEVETQVANQLNEIKALDASLNENALFVHATKYGFRDLKLAHQNMRDMSEMAKKVQGETAKNIAKRQDPVSSTPGATGIRPDPSAFENAAAYLRSLK